MTKPPPVTAKRFFTAVRRDDVAQVRSFLDAGFDLTTNYGAGGATAQSALHEATYFDAVEVVFLLLDRGADVAARDAFGQSALHCAREPAIAGRLIAGGADIHARDNEGRTPLHAAAAVGVDLVRLLVEAGADVHAIDQDGHTPYQLARGVEVRDLLREHGDHAPSGTPGQILQPERRVTPLSEVPPDHGCLGIDGSGAVWLAGHAGVFRINQDATADHFRFAESFAISHIRLGADGAMYAATNAGLLQWQGTDFRLFTMANSELHDDHLVGLCTRLGGGVFLLGYEDDRPDPHIGVFDGATFALLRPGVDFPNGLDVTCVAVGPDGGLVLGCANGVARQVGGPHGSWSHIERLGRASITPDSVSAIEVVGGEIWLGASTGVYRMVGDAVIEQHPTGLARCLCWDGESMWVGTYFDGLVRIRAGEVIRHRAADSGLGSDDVTDLARARDGGIWLLAGSTVSCLRGGEFHPLTPGTETDGQDVDARTEAPRSRQRRRPLPAAPLIDPAALPDDLIRMVRNATESEAVSQALLALARPGVDFTIDGGAAPLSGGSKFGGLPDLPESMAWPMFSRDDDECLPFIMQVNLAEVAPFDLEELLPREGMLYFFCDTCPDTVRDARVVYADAPVEQLVGRELPMSLADRMDDVDFIAVLPQWSLRPRARFTLPSIPFLAARIDVAGEDEQKLSTVFTELAASSAGCRLLGWPDTRPGELLETHNDILLFQLDGEELTGPGAENGFPHWMSDGLVQTIIRRKHLLGRRFDSARTRMSNT